MLIHEGALVVIGRASEIAVDDSMEDVALQMKPEK